MTRRLRGLVALALSLFPFAASASGFLFGDNGSRALSLGGAFAAQADDLTAIQHNPAGLVQSQGFSFLLDAHGLNHEVRFMRKDADGGTAAEAEVRNEGGVFLLPFLGFGYGRELAGRRFTASLGVYGPPSVGRYVFPEPNYTRITDERGREVYEQDPRKFASQRYGLIRNDIIILFPSLSAAYEVLPNRLSVGASFQYVYSHLMFRQAVTSALVTPAEQRNEDPRFDSIVVVNQVGRPAFTGIFGVMFKPMDLVQFGASYRPPVPLHTEGTVDIELGEIPSQLATIEGNRAEFQLTLPQELKLGVSVRPLPALRINAEAVYQGWQSVQQFVLTPTNVTMALSGAEAEPLAPIHIEKRWHHIWSGRLGAQYAFDFGLTARAGVLFEQSASDDERQHIDFLHFTRAFVTGGLEYQLGPVSVVAVGAYTPYQTKEVTGSQVRQANTDPNVEGAVIGNGTYTSGGWIAGLGVRGSFGGDAGPTSGLQPGRVRVEGQP